MRALTAQRRLVPSTVAAVFLVISSPALAGPWSQLPDAVDRLAEHPGDEDAERVLRLAEGSLLREAQVGHLAEARSLFDTYASLVIRLPDAGRRLGRVERRVADVLWRQGDELQSEDLRRAAAAWSLAAELDPESPAANRLRWVLQPPSPAEPGDVWRAPVDGAELVFHPAMAIRMGCTEGDGACLDNEIFFKWVEVPAGWFEREEVTNRRYRLCVDAGSCTAPENRAAFDDRARSGHPVVGVSWGQARAYARWAGRRLPSEAEWERAARGETTDLRFPWGNGKRRGLANVWEDPRSPASGGTVAVGSFPATGWGVNDMAGNVWEWCHDRYEPRFSDDSADGGAARKGWGRVVRGGSWRRAIEMARVSVRSWYDVGYFADDLGFRCVADHGSEMSAEELVRAAQRAFPIDIGVGHELDRAQLEVEDRRFLERRSITLFVIEGRMDDALTPAGLRLKREPRDPVAIDLFDRFENDMVERAGEDGLADVDRGLAAYREAATQNPRLDGRRASFERRLLDVLRRVAQTSEVRGDRGSAFAATQVALVIAPGDRVLQAAAVRLARKTGETRVWAGDGKGMVWIAPALMRFGASLRDGSANNNEHPAHTLNVGGFWIDRTEVTNDEYRSCVQAGVCPPPHRTEVFDDPNLGNHPVLWVDWFQARTYAGWAGKRLATEVEWERAARAGAETAFPWGGSWHPGWANGVGTAGNDIWGGTAPVASFEPNAWGIYDLIGNVTEWVEDVYNESFYNSPRDGHAWHQETGLAGERRRVVRGGGYDDPPSRQRVSRRADRRPDDFHRTVGFRCVADE